MMTGSHGHEVPLLMIGAKLIGSLLFVLALFLAGVFLVRFLQRQKILSPRRPENEIEIRATRSVGPKAQVALVSVGSHSFLIGIVPSGISLLGRVEDSPTRNSASPMAQTVSRPAHSMPSGSPISPGSEPASFDVAVREALDRIGALGKDRGGREKPGRWSV